MVVMALLVLGEPMEAPATLGENVKLTAVFELPLTWAVRVTVWPPETLLELRLSPSVTRTCAGSVTAARHSKITRRAADENGSRRTSILTV